MSDKERAEHANVSVGAYDMDCELEVQCSCGEMLLTHEEGLTALTLLEILVLHRSHLVEVLS